MKYTVDKLLKLKNLKELHVTAKQRNELKSVLLYMETSDLLKMSSIKCILPKMLKSGVDDLYVRRLVRNKKYCKTGISLYKNLILYGRKGYEYWDLYRKRQAYTNTFEYKKKKYNWSEEDFKKYNQSRAATIENYIKRHGEIEGARLWDIYLKRQAYTNTFEYYIEKFNGDKIKAKYEFNKYNKSKAITYKNLMIKYNDEDKVLKILENKYCSQYYSLVSQKLFNKIYHQLDTTLQNKTYFATLNKEYGRYNKITEKYHMFDFVISNIKFCIEFNGDHYHANPSIYKPDEIPIVYPKESQYRSKILWEKDIKKNNTLNSIGFECIVVWEGDFNKNENEIVNKCLRIINERNKTFNRL